MVKSARRVWRGSRRVTEWTSPYLVWTALTAAAAAKRSSARALWLLQRGNKGGTDRRLGQFSQPNPWWWCYTTAQTSRKGHFWGKEGAGDLKAPLVSLFRSAWVDIFWAIKKCCFTFFRSRRQGISSKCVILKVRFIRQDFYTAIIWAKNV